MENLRPNSAPSTVKNTSVPLKLTVIILTFILTTGLSAATDLNNIESITPAGSNPIYINGTLNMNGNPINSFFGSSCPSGDVAVHVNDDGTIDCIDATGEVQGDFVSRSGDTMEGTLDMQGNRLQNVIAGGGQNMIYDGSFEFEDTSEEGAGDGSCWDSDSKSVSYINGDAPHGDTYKEIVHTHNGGGCQVNDFNSNQEGGGSKIPVRPSTKYTISVYARTDETHNWNNLFYVRNYDSSNNEVQINDYDVKVGTEWERYTYTFTTHSSAEYVRVDTYHYTTATLYLDGYHLQPGTVASQYQSSRRAISGRSYIEGPADVFGSLDMNSNAINNADWSDANDLNSGGTISDFSAANDLNSGGTVTDFSNANDLDGNGNVAHSLNDARNDGAVITQDSEIMIFDKDSDTWNSLEWRDENNNELWHVGTQADERFYIYDHSTSDYIFEIQPGGNVDIQNRNLDMNNQNVQNLHRIGDPGQNNYIDFTQSSSWLEVQDQSGSREEIVTQDVYVNEDGVWLGSHIGDSDAHHVKTTDTSAATQCSGNDYLAGDGTCNADSYAADNQNLGTSGNQITLDNGGSVTAPYANNADTLDGEQLTDVLNDENSDVMSSDWNTLTEPGMYGVGGSSWSGSNQPTSAYTYGHLIVTEGNGDTDGLMQMYVSHHSARSGSIWFRSGFKDGSWDAWHAIPTREWVNTNDDTIPDDQDVQASASGDTIDISIDNGNGASATIDDDDASTRCSGNDYLAGDGTCNADSYEANTDNQNLGEVLSQGNSADQNIDMNGNSINNAGSVKVDNSFQLPVGADAY